MSNYKVSDSELTGIANAIRTNGGTSSQLVFPTEFISAINAIPRSGGGGVSVYHAIPDSNDGAEGDLAVLASYDGDVSNIEYIRMTIYAYWQGSYGVAMDEIELYDDNGARVEWPVGTTISANFNAYGGNSVEKLIDGNLTGGYLSNGAPSPSNPVIITIRLGGSIDFYGIRWYTPWDSPGRDPKDFRFEVSTDGGAWNLVSDVTDCPQVSARNVIAYSIEMDSRFISVFTKQQGTWIDPAGVLMENINI